MAPIKKLISLNDAAEIYGVHPRTVRRLIDTGQLTGYKIGSKLVRVDLAEVQAHAPIPTADAS